MKRLSWKYIAGLVDARGRLEWRYRYNSQHPDAPFLKPLLKLTLEAPGDDVVSLLCQNFGGRMDLSVVPAESDWIGTVHWRIEGKQARPLLQNIVNHVEMSGHQFRLAIWLIDHGMGRPVPLSVRERLATELRAMQRDRHRLSEAAIIEVKTLWGDALAMDAIVGLGAA